MRLRDDIDLATTWVTSDTHYGHDNIVGFCRRPEDHDQVMIAEWRKVALPGRTMLHLGDLSYKGNAWFKHIIAKELTGPGTADRNLLVKGNHDKNPYKFYKDAGFTLARPFAIPVIEGSDGFEVFQDAIGIAKLGDKEYREFMSSYAGAFTISFSHYAWGGRDEEGVERQPENHWRLHGHIHNNGYYDARFKNADGTWNRREDMLVPFLARHINLSVEQTGYKPVNLRALLDAAILGRLPVAS